MSQEKHTSVPLKGKAPEAREREFKEVWHFGVETLPSSPAACYIKGTEALRGSPTLGQPSQRDTVSRKRSSAKQPLPRTMSAASAKGSKLS